MIKLIKKIFIRGLAKVIPIALTIYIVVGLFFKVDQWLQPYIIKYLKIDLPGLGFAILLVLIFIAGLFRVKFLENKLNDITEKVPLIKDVYVPLKDLTLMILDKDKNTFKDVVMCKDFPSKGYNSMGFITNENDVYTTIMIPTTPNPSNGFLIFVEDKTKYRVMDMTVKEGLTKVVQMGTVSK